MKRKLIGADQRRGVYCNLPRFIVAEPLIQELRVHKILQIGFQHLHIRSVHPQVDGTAFDAAVHACDHSLVGIGRALYLRRFAHEVGRKVPHADAFAFIDAFQLLFQPFQHRGQRHVPGIQGDSSGRAKRIGQHPVVHKVEGFARCDRLRFGRAGTAAPGDSSRFACAVRIAEPVTQRF